MTVYRWEPRREIEAAGKKLRRFFDDFESGLQNGVHIELGTFSPRVDISESKDTIYVRAELPGMKAEDVKITLSEGTLTLRGNKKRMQAGSTAPREDEASSNGNSNANETTSTNGNAWRNASSLRDSEVFHRIERSHGEFVRQFALPDNLNEDAVTAEFTDGVLLITIPKTVPEKPVEREVKIVSK